MLGGEDVMWGHLRQHCNAGDDDDENAGDDEDANQSDHAMVLEMVVWLYC